VSVSERLIKPGWDPWGVVLIRLWLIGHQRNLQNRSQAAVIRLYQEQAYFLCSD
jgi:hypothetical protein